MLLYQSLQQYLSQYGLRCCGVVECSHGDIVLVGAAGSDFWCFFSQSPEFCDGLANSLDRWSENILTKFAENNRVKVLMPNDGPPFYPFQAWAKQIEWVYPSPLGILIHPQFGLWHAYRGALQFMEEKLEPSLKGSDNSSSPCESCVEQPCLTHCPVGAFSLQGYAYQLCADYLNTEVSACNEQGCLARLACPIDIYQYKTEHHLFHLELFKKAHHK